MAFRNEKIKIHLIGFNLRGNHGLRRQIADRCFQRHIAIEQPKR